MRIVSPMPTGCGAYLLHKTLEEQIKGYEVVGYNPWRTLMPLCLPRSSIKKADIIHTSADYGLFFSRRNTPLVLTFHGYTLDYFVLQYSNLAQRIHYQSDLRYFIKRALTKTNYITAVSEFIAKLVKEDIGYQGDIQVIHNGIDYNRFQPTKSKKTTKNTTKALFVGNLSRKKGAHWLPEIADGLNPGIEILYTTGLRNKQSILNSANLVNIGRIKYEDMPKLYNEVDLLLFPTVREGFGLAVLEAMACGLPVVASNCSALPELIDDGKGGFLCPVGDTRSFADQINLIAENKALRVQMGEYNREKVVEKFALDTMVNKYNHLFQRTLS